MNTLLFSVESWKLLFSCSSTKNFSFSSISLQLRYFNICLSSEQFLSLFLTSSLLQSSLHQLLGLHYCRDRIHRENSHQHDDQGDEWQRRRTESNERHFSPLKLLRFGFWLSAFLQLFSHTEPALHEKKFRAWHFDETLISPMRIFRLSRKSIAMSNLSSDNPFSQLTTACDGWSGCIRRVLQWLTICFQNYHPHTNWRRVNFSYLP